MERGEFARKFACRFVRFGQIRDATTEFAAENSAGEYHAAMVATCAIRSRCAPRVFLRGMSSERSDQYRPIGYSDSGNRNLPEVPCARPGSRRVALLRMPHVSRLGKTQRSEADVYVAGIAFDRQIICTANYEKLCALDERHHLRSVALANDFEFGQTRCNVLEVG